MRTMLKATFDVGAGNQAMKNGALPKVMKEVMDKLKPEASYFYSSNGRRACLVVFDLKDSSDIPSVAEPLFLNMNAEVELTPVMNVDDLQKGLANVVNAKMTATALN